MWTRCNASPHLTNRALPRLAACFGAITPGDRLFLLQPPTRRQLCLCKPRGGLPGAAVIPIPRHPVYQLRDYESLKAVVQGEPSNMSPQRNAAPTEVITLTASTAEHSQDAMTQFQVQLSPWQFGLATPCGPARYLQGKRPLLAFLLLQQQATHCQLPVARY